ncbi:hypothetical protein B0T22DRAFT_485581 [Podospora appendiculata]|uniref:Uncharacterized protein n=1 Tax=Podospora appendiculata TaxID=314037 RepID=A0AAE0WZ14_9PEZI|nr:hypothetical protein B0T22DRAFT_485581 [Podospora appendiculata]
MQSQQPSAPSRQPSTTTASAQAGLAAIRNLNPPEYAVADTPGTSDPFGSGTDYMNYRPAPKCEHIPDDGTTTPSPPPPLSGLSTRSLGVRGGLLPSNAQKESEAHAAGGGHVLHRHPLRQSENVDGEQQAETGSGSVSGVPLRHGRVRGEVTLDGDEAEMERKKAQHSLARVQLKEELRKGEGVCEAGRSQAEPGWEIGSM